LARSLTAVEIQEAQIVFQGSLTYGRVSVAENVGWPNWIGRLGARLQGTTLTANNAVTLGNQVTFPVALNTSLEDIQANRLSDIAWLIHELTHVLQFQKVGFIYLFQALAEQIRHGSEAYDYGGESGLTEARAKGFGAKDFKREQQGNLARDYYLRAKSNKDLTAWEPFISEFRAGHV
jgi:hypothetical protein